MLSEPWRGALIQSFWLTAYGFGVLNSVNRVDSLRGWVVVVTVVLLTSMLKLLTSTNRTTTQESGTTNQPES
jgi:hypothetical protein